MTQFNGFASGKPDTIPMHAQFFSEVMPLVDDLAEMKVVLFSYWALWQKEGHFRHLTWDDFVQSRELTEGLRTIEGDTPVETALQAALDRAVAHNILLRGNVTLQSGELAVYLFNTARGRAAIQQLAQGHWQPSDTQHIEILPERPNIFTLYEENIGVIGSMMRDELLDAEKDFSYEWIVAAIGIAVKKNIRNWQYISAILRRWKQEGRADEKTQRELAELENVYTGGKWSDIIES